MNKKFLLFLLLPLLNYCIIIGCSKFNEIIYKTFCQTIIPSDAKKQCIFKDNNCIEIYRECSDYKGKDENECKSILLDGYKKCSMIDGECKESTVKECSEINFSQENCNEYHKQFYNTGTEPNENIMKCSFINGKCIERPTGCPNYEGIKKEECESIILYDDNNDIRSKCSFTEEGCKLAKIECSDYNPESSPYECKQIYPTEDTHCVYLNGHCKESFISCNLGANEEICKSIYPIEYRTYKCTYSSQKGCFQEYRKCSDYEYDKNIECKDLGSNCHLINGKCIPFDKCTDYEGNDKVICESIRLSNMNGGYQNKCSFVDGKCISVKKQCSDYVDRPDSFLDSAYCDENVLDDSTKHCILNNTKCIEQYKDCSSYKGSNKEECESIFPENHYSFKCVFKDNKCQKVQMECSDFMHVPQLYKSYCEITFRPLDESKICSLSGNICTETSKKTDSSEEEELNGSLIKLSNIIYLLILLFL